MTDTKQIDLQSLQRQALQQAGVDAAKTVTASLTVGLQNQLVALAVMQAEKAMAEEQVAELKKKVAKLEAELAAARGEVSDKPVAGKAGKAGKPAS